MAKRMIKIKMVLREKTHLKGEHTKDNAIAVRHTVRDLVSHRKSSYKWFRNRTKVLEASLRPATRARPEVGGAPGDANSRTTVLGEAVATEDAVDVPQHVGG